LPYIRYYETQKVSEFVENINVSLDGGISSVRLIDTCSKAPGLCKQCKQHKRAVVNRSKLFRLTLERGAGISAKSGVKINQGKVQAAKKAIY